MSGSDVNSVFPGYYSSEHESSGYTLHSKIMTAAIVVLFVVVFFVLALHIYAKCFWRQRHASLIRRRYQFDFAGQESSGVAGSIGLEKDVIENLPTFTYEAPRSEEEVLECAVCLCEFKENEKGRLLPKCNHSFHIECIDMWFHSHSTCPLCRTCAVPDSTLDIPTPQEHESTESTAADIPQHMEALWLAGALQQQDVAAENTGLRRATQGTGHSSPASVGTNTGSISERFHEDQGMGYPANVLSWGNHSHACSNMNLPLMEEAHPGGRSLPHTVIDIPIRSESSLTARCLSLNTPRRGGSISSLLCPSSEELPSSPNDQSLKSPITRFKSLKRLLSRERKVPAAQHATVDCDQFGPVSNS